MIKKSLILLMCCSTYSYADDIQDIYDSQYPDSCTNTAAVSGDYPNCIYEYNCPRVDTFGQKGLQSYQQKQFDTARAYFKLQATWNNACDLSSHQQAVAYNNVAMTYIQQKEYLKAKAWIELAPSDKVSLHNLQSIEPKLNEMIQKATSPAGEYWQYAGYGIWNILTITKQDNNLFSITYEGYYAGINVFVSGPNIGTFEAELPIEDNQAIYHLKDDYMECDVTMQFSPTHAILTRQGNCGFGHNVDASGNFTRVSVY